MAKKITDKNGNTFVEVKPWYKRWWIWVIAVVIILAIIGSIAGNNDDDSSSSKGSSSTQVSHKSHATAQQKAALASAKTYSDDMHMSKQGIYDQLTSDDGDKFKDSDAQYAIDHLNADYNHNALESAKSYQKDQHMSTDEIRDQLTSDDGDKFTQDQADYAINHLPK